MAGVYELVLSTADGREMRTLAWYPSEAVRQDLYEKARRLGLEISEKEILKTNGI